MTPAGDRIPVPTNGHHAPLAEDASPDAAPAVPDAASAAIDDAATAERAPIEITFSPGQLALGFGILAGIALLVLGRRRGRRG